MLTLTAFERALRTLLVCRVRQSGGRRESLLMTYGELNTAVAADRRQGDPELRWPQRGFHDALGHVSMYEVEHGRPMLTAIVVTQETGQPGDGFWRLARHLGFEVRDERQFWEDEVEALLDAWLGDGTDVTLPIIDAVDRSVEVLDRRIRAVERIVRRGTTLPYLDWTTQWNPRQLVLKNVGTGPAVGALYVACWPGESLVRSAVFAVAAGEGMSVPLRGARLTLMEDAMGEPVNGVTEILVCKDGTGRWLRFRPRADQRPDVWVEERDAAGPRWINWYRDVVKGIETGG